MPAPEAAWEWAWRTRHGQTPTSQSTRRSRARPPPAHGTTRVERASTHSAHTRTRGHTRARARTYICRSSGAHDLSEGALGVGRVLEGVEDLLHGDDVLALFVHALEHHRVSAFAQLLLNVVLSQHMLRRRQGLEKVSCAAAKVWSMVSCAFKRVRLLCPVLTGCSGATAPYRRPQPPWCRRMGGCCARLSGQGLAVAAARRGANSGHAPKPGELRLSA